MFESECISPTASTHRVECRMACAVIKSNPSFKFSGYRLNIQNKDGVFECVSYSCGRKDGFFQKVERIVLGHTSINKAHEIIDSLRQRVNVEKTVLEKIYEPVLKCLTEDQLWYFPFCECNNTVPYCQKKYIFGTFEDKAFDTFRTEEKTESIQGYSIRHICIDVRFGTDADFKSLIDEIVKIHRTPYFYSRDSNCHVLGLTQVRLCREFINDVGSFLDALEVDMVRRSVFTVL